MYSFYCLLQLVIPTILISHAAQRIANTSYQCRARSNKHFKTVFLRFRVSLSKRSSSHKCRDTPHFREVFRKFDGFDVFSCHRSHRGCHCSTTPSHHSAFIFVPVRKFVGFDVIFSPFALFVFAVLLSSFTPATVSQFCRY